MYVVTFDTSLIHCIAVGTIHCTSVWNSEIIPGKVEEEYQKNSNCELYVFSRILESARIEISHLCF